MTHPEKSVPPFIAAILGSQAATWLQTDDGHHGDGIGVASGSSGPVNRSDMNGEAANGDGISGDV